MRLTHYLVTTLVILLTLIQSVYAQDKVKIGVLLALTGPYPMQGNAFREGLQLAEDTINKSGGIDGKEIEVIFEDTVNEAKNALTAAKKLSEKDGVVAAIMSSYPEYRTGGMEFQRNKIPSIALWDSSPELDDMGDFIFGIGPWTPSSGEVSAKFASEQIKADTAVVLTSVDPWSELIGDYFTKAFTKSGGKILKSYSINPGTSDYKAILSQIKSLAPEVIFAPLIDNIPVFYKQKNSFKITIPTVSSDIISDEHIQQAPVAMEGTYQARNREPNNSKSKEVFDKYEKKFGKKVTMPWFITTAYDGLMLIVDAIQKSSTNGEDIKNALYTIQNYKGATQEFSFTIEGSAPQLAVMYRIQDGKLELFWDPKDK